MVYHNLIILLILLQQVTFRADKQVRKTNVMLKGLTKGDVAPGENIAWNGEVENIPSMPPTKLGGGCRNIEVKYLLSVSISLLISLLQLT